MLPGWLNRPGWSRGGCTRCVEEARGIFSPILRGRRSAGEKTPIMRFNVRNGPAPELAAKPKKKSSSPLAPGCPTRGERARRSPARLPTAPCGWRAGRTTRGVQRRHPETDGGKRLMRRIGRCDAVASGRAAGEGWAGVPGTRPDPRQRSMSSPSTDRSRRRADVAGRGRGRRCWSGTARRGVASGRTDVPVKGAIPRLDRSGRRPIVIAAPALPRSPAFPPSE
jgi:hypothetical protein